MFSRLTLIFFLFFLVTHSLHVSAKTWCVSDPSATDAQLQANLDWLCGSVLTSSCVIINPGGPCYEPNTLTNHASYMMNDYYQFNGGTKEACDFNHSGRIVDTNPSHGGCVFA
ncbi:PREDICTED: major pollen allergen Ole e 10-like [Camelina sativa]|uniref:Major pollen allergen Ole e 10-like n=1 Tax=Camelina sativa TaxID=90675 RepID=A0ABM0WFZ8_CAMSA|nr:PREDICTED: major pollen allergen Ole e 10-like [Camelina sativa]